MKGRGPLTQDYPPEYDDEPNCPLCGLPAGLCECPPCPVCGVSGDERCITEHGMVMYPMPLLKDDSEDYSHDDWMGYAEWIGAR